MSQKKGGAVAHHVVVGPDAGEDVGDANTRAMPALPTFESRGTSLESIQTQPPTASGRVSSRPAPANNAPLPSEPMSVAGTTQSAAPPHGRRESDPPKPSFGENTLLWMQPPKPPAPAVTSTNVVTGDLAAKPRDMLARRLKAGVIGASIVLLIGALWFATGKRDRGVVELYTLPEKATVIIDGKVQAEVSPVKLTLPVGQHQIRLELANHKPQDIMLTVEKGEEAVRRDIDLEPISQPGLLTVAIAVQPVSARITVDGKVHEARRSLMLANVDPKKPHKISIEAGGYVKVEQEIPANELKPTYTFVMQQDQDAKLE